MEHVKCDLCGNDDYLVVNDKAYNERIGTTYNAVLIKDEDGEILNGRNVVCNYCSLVYITPRMEKEVLDEFYKEDYRRYYNNPKNGQSSAIHAQNAFNIVKDLELTGDFLDIGCYQGDFLELMGDNTCGIEPSDEGYRRSKEKGLKVEQVTIEEYQPDRQFDGVTLFNTLEHVVSPTKTMQRIFDLVKDKGHVLVSVPNVLNTAVVNRKDVFLSNMHLYNFSLYTLEALFIKCGFKPVRHFIVIEPIGEKIYLLGVKDEPEELEFEYLTQNAELIKRRFDCWDTAYDLKEKLYNLGFR